MKVKKMACFKSLLLLLLFLVVCWTMFQLARYFEWRFKSIISLTLDAWSYFGFQQKLIFV